MRCPHTRFTKGKRIRVVLRSGEEFVDRYESTTSTHMVFRERGKVIKSSIRNTSVYKEQDHAVE